MPKVSEFFGISIYFYYRDHHPPHFHAIYGSAQAAIAIDDLALLEGRLPPRALGMVMEWADAHRAELERAWQQARERLPLDLIEPLK